MLGLRLTAKSVNQDDPSVYHLFYGDEVGSPAPTSPSSSTPERCPAEPGAGMVYRVVWRVGSPEALGFWADRLEAEGVAVERGESSLLFADLEGLQHELVVDESGDPPLVADHPEIPAALALHGFDGVRAYSYRPQSTAVAARAPDERRAARRRPLGAARRRRRGWIALDPIPDEPGEAERRHDPPRRLEHDRGRARRWLEVLQEAGIPNSGLVDRHYFRSIYFREPGGILFELATAEPGFIVDGPVEELGTKIILPPWLEQQRPAIESRLTPLPDPRADWAPVTG